MFYFDPMYFVFALPPMLLVLWAQSRVKGAYAKYSQIRNMANLTGAQVARILLQTRGLEHITVEPVGGELSDHYDPTSKVLRLSEGVYSSPSVAAMGIVAHEVGHAVQDAVGYVPLRLRSALVPAVNLGSTLGYIFFFAGLVINWTGLAWLGIGFFSLGVVFALATLPVEYNASNRALALLKGNGLVSVEEYQGAKDVLSAAALTYVAAVAAALGSLLYYVWLLMGRREE
ncbi:MAG: zinc metallopeptidase [Sphingomonadaceae bacterium]